MPKTRKTAIEKEIIRKSNILGKVEHIELFEKSGKRCAIIINKVVYHAIRLVSYSYKEKEVKVISVKRFPNLVDFYQSLEVAKERAEEIKKSSQELLSKEVNSTFQDDTYKFETQEDDAKNILVVGRTGNGKSTLANVLLNKNNNFEEVFKESSGGTSKTRNFESEIFEHQGVKYRIVDTIGVGDTKLSKKDVLYRIAEGIYSMKGGINQILLVIGGRFTKEEVESFVMLKSAILGSGIANHTTIVRTRFPEFKDSEKCDEDRELLKNENGKIYDLLNSCNDIIYVDNPSLPMISEKDKGEEIKYKEQEINVNKKKREESRRILLEHLESRCQGNYKLENWDYVCVRISDFMNAKKRLKEYLENMKSGDLRTGKWIAKNMLLNDIKDMEKEIIKEIREQFKEEKAEVECRIEIPAIAKFELITRLSNHKCCSVM